MSSAARNLHNATPLAHSTLTVTITDLVAEYELRHAFRNEGSDAIEAVYSFPVPLDSAFMGMEATLVGERRAAQVQPRAQASQNYDDAIADGDSAVLLERLEPGMLCVSLGNLKPGEDGEVVLRFAAPLRCAGGTARFSLPLVHRPRYGRSRLDELVEPHHDFAVEHPLDATIRVRGLLTRTPVSCATHAARFATDGEGQTLQLNQGMLDRDLVLVFELPRDFVGQARLLRDGDAAIGMLSFNVPEGIHQVGPCDLCLVMDGSGSMTGDAILQSRAALAVVAGLLGDQDRIQVIRFGSRTVPLFRRPLKASARVRDAIEELSGTIDSSLGGTDIHGAVVMAIAELTRSEAVPGRSRVIILVTDGAGQPQDVKGVAEFAIEHGIRIFVVAVGSSAGADVLAPLATNTNGVLERAVPAEPIDEVVMRQLGRARETGPITAAVDWGSAEADPLPIDPVYAGDAVTAIAKLPGNRSFEPAVRIGGNRVALPLRLDNIEDAPALLALAGHAAWQHAPEDAKARLALRYGLVTDETSAVLVKVRADGKKVDGLPVIVPVAHMVPEGMVAARSTRHLAMSMRMEAQVSHVAEYLDLPAFLRRDGGSAQVSERRVMRSHRERVDPASAAPITLSPSALDALSHALIHLLLDDEAKDVTLEKLLALVDSAWREQVASYLAIECPHGVDRRSATKLLEALLARKTRITLSDDQEARLACIASERYATDSLEAR